MRRREKVSLAIQVPDEIMLAMQFPVGWTHWATPQALAKLRTVRPDDPNRQDAVRDAQLVAWRTRCAALDHWAAEEGFTRREALQLGAQALGRERRVPLPASTS